MVSTENHISNYINVGSPVIDPFCIVDMGLESGAKLVVKVSDLHHPNLD
jgi:hypothetical protein